MPDRRTCRLRLPGEAIAGIYICASGAAGNVPAGYETTARQEIQMKTVGICVCVIGLAFAAGCGSQLRYGQEMRKITIDSEPEGALVYQVNPVGNERIFLGTTPLKEQTVLVPVRLESLGRATSEYAAKSQLQMVQVVIEKDGYKTFVSNLATVKDETMKHPVTLERK
jgi:hypothetical protein